MRRVSGVLVLFISLAGVAAAQPVPPPAALEPSPAPSPVYQPPPPGPYFAPDPEPRRRSWFGAVGLGGMGYVGREGPDGVVNDPDKGSGVALEAVAGKWLGGDFAIGARLEAHTDDAESYTDSSMMVVARFPLGATGRFYLEPGLGLGFHKSEGNDSTDAGVAMAMTGGYALTRGRFAFDLRFGLSHSRIDHPNPEDSFSHGTAWVGGAIGFQ